MDHHYSGSYTEAPVKPSRAVSLETVVVKPSERVLMSLDSLNNNHTDSLISPHIQDPYPLTRRRRSYSDGPPKEEEQEPQQTFIIPKFQKLRQRVRTRASELMQARRRRRPRSRWLIAADHPFKIMWDFGTILLSFVAAYFTHTAIRDRSFGQSSFGTFCECWFLVDILLNFVTEHKTSEGQVLRDGKAVWARYLTTWFVVDALSLFPWESLYVKPIIEMQNRRNLFKKSFFRTRAVIRVSRFLRGRHFRLFGRVAKHTKLAGVGAHRLLRLLIKYVPKYLLFYRNMKGVLAVRTLRQVHWIRKFMKNLSTRSEKQDDATDSLTYVDDDDYELDDDDNMHGNDGGIVHIQYEKNQIEMDDDDEEEDDVGLY